MAHWLATPADQLTKGVIKRFDPRFWTVDFPRPMMAAATTPEPGTLRIDARFYRKGDLAGIIWESEDRWDHPLLGYETARDFRECVLSFHWQSGGVIALDALNGPTLTIEGRDEEGTPRAWFVRLWNYADGTAEDAEVRIDFATVTGGYLLPDEADPVWAGDVDRMFVSLAPPGYVEGDASPLAAPADGWAEMRDIACEGGGAVLAIGDAMLPEHAVRIASGYDDSYNVTPARLLRNIVQLGYRGTINHYVGMSHYFRLAADGADFLVDAGGEALNAPCAAWHADLAARVHGLGYSLILSLSYELFAEYCPADWMQRAADGSPALTGWTPPSALLSPAHATAMAYLRDVACAFVEIAQAAGLAVRFQVGEPWWWVMPDGRPCLYDTAAVAAFGGSPVAIPTVRSTSLSMAQKALLDEAGALLSASTAALCDAVRTMAPDAETLLLVYLPTVLDAAAPDLRRANVPTGWASPAFDVLQCEDYDWVTTGNIGASGRGIAAITARLGYPVSAQHYLSGFVLAPADRAQWRLIAAAADAARARGTAEIFVWALPQVIRDGFVHFEIGDEQGEGAVEAFDDISFPLALGRHASVETCFSTAIVTSAGGHEQRNADWSDARMRYDAGPGVRSEEDMAALLAFFRARHGPARGFRFRDPLDDSSNGMTGTPSPVDQILGEGDGIATGFALVKHYDALTRRITRPVPESVTVALDGVVQAEGWSLGADGVLTFVEAPADGVTVSAGFRFDVPVRFEQDRLEVTLSTLRAGEAASVPLIEIREG